MIDKHLFDGFCRVTGPKDSVHVVGTPHSTVGISVRCTSGNPVEVVFLGLDEAKRLAAALQTFIADTENSQV